MAVPKLGNVLSGSVSVEGRSCNSSWGCRTVTVSDGHRYWKLDCEGLVSKPGEQIDLVVSGVKPYTVTLMTDPVPEGEHVSQGYITFRLVGHDGTRTSDLSLASGTRTPGLSVSARFYGADVGQIDAINVTNHTPNDPWRFKYLTVNFDGGGAKFVGGPYVGTPFSKSVVFRNVYVTDDGSASADAAEVPVECHTRLADIVSGSVNLPLVVKTRCPAGCDSSPLSLVNGLSLHASTSSVCASAVADGTIGVSGGTVLLQLYPSDHRDLTSLYTKIGLLDIHAYRDDPTDDSTFYFTTARITSLDDLDSSIRIVDAFQTSSHTGRLELRESNGTWGSVCKQGETEQFGLEAAKVACQELGFLWGSLLTEQCSALSLCGPKTLPVVAGGITCKGVEDGVGKCAVQKPAHVCADHSEDVLVHCTDVPPNIRPSQSALRLIDSSGAPAVRGIGRLEMYVANQWTTICNDKWSSVNAGVACRDMGYTGVKDIVSLTTVASSLGTGPSKSRRAGAGRGGGRGKADLDEDMCASVMGSNYCGRTDQRIGVTEVACEGSELRLRDCALSAPEDVYCVHTEDVVVGCDGPGDPSGVGLFAADHAPKLRYIPLKPTQAIKCSDSFDSLFSKLEPLPGEMFVLRCPAGCTQSGQGSVIGSILYDWQSLVCLAAVHSGIIDDSGQVFAAVAGHGQFQFVGKEQNGLVSEEGAAADNSFYIVKMTADLTARMPLQTKDLSVLGGGGKSMLSDKFVLERENNKRTLTTDNVGDGGSTLGAQSAGPISFLQTGASGTAATGTAAASGMTSTKRSRQQVPVPLVAFCNEDTSVKFDGSSKAQVTMNELPGGQSLSSLYSFTVALRFKPDADANSGWRSIVSYSECDGFNIVLSPEGELVFEQLCSPLVVPTQIFPDPAKWSTVSVVYNHEYSALTILDGTKIVARESVGSNVFRWNSLLKLGESSTLEYEPFTGSISHVLIFNTALLDGKEDVSAIDMVNNRLGDICRRLQATQAVPNYSDVDYKLCISECAKSTNSRIRKKMSRIQLARAPAIPVECTSTLDNTVALSGKMNGMVEVLCPLNCFSNQTLGGSNTGVNELGGLLTSASKPDAFPGSYRICSAAAVLGFIPTEKTQRLQLSILPGKLNYLPSATSMSPQDSIELRNLASMKDIRSFTITALTEPQTIPCRATAEFLVFQPVGHARLLRCPKGCQGSKLDQKGPVPPPQSPLIESARTKDDSLFIDVLSYAPSFVQNDEETESAKGLLTIRDPSVPICELAVDLGLLTPTTASDVLVYVAAKTEASFISTPTDLQLPNLPTAQDWLASKRPAAASSDGSLITYSSVTDLMNEDILFGGSEHIHSRRPSEGLLSASFEHDGNTGVKTGVKTGVSTEWFDGQDVNGVFTSVDSEWTEARSPSRGYGILPLFSSIRCADSRIGDLPIGMNLSSKTADRSPVGENASGVMFLPESDLMENYHCDGASEISGRIATLPGYVKIPALGVVVSFNEEGCFIGKSAAHTREPEGDILPRRFQLQVSYERLQGSVEDGEGTMTPCYSHFDDLDDLKDLDEDPYSYKLYGSFQNVLIQRVQ
ncbi:putative scavenger receptor [Gregarina niphandrodes]|uniref:Scavenger receptor n=1 Tax=Gregarina niphandrodes TaxID=110365 RepID=A0A023BDB4_GRENI|nr:putative scavenger receptor [Gregarina niphandrodes]EZG88144.1 putative scavenger receptor [Gregarina niphandrodes]|eukprot:XP_011128621.1 putative scavenger receptor [Gregarina niphandrodes]